MNLANDTHTIKVTVEVINGAETQTHKVAEIVMKLENAPLGWATYDMTVTQGEKTFRQKVYSMLQEGYLATVKKAMEALYRD